MRSTGWVSRCGAIEVGRHHLDAIALQFGDHNAAPVGAAGIDPREHAAM